MTKRLPGTMQAGLLLPDNWIDDSGIRSREAFAAFAMILEENSKFTTVNLSHSFIFNLPSLSFCCFICSCLSCV